MEKKCLYCGAVLPQEASFCHCCAKNQRTKRLVRLPRGHRRRGALWALGAGLLIGGMVLFHPGAVDPAQKPSEAPETTAAPSAAEALTEALTEAPAEASTGAAQAPNTVQLKDVLPGEVPVPEPVFAFDETAIARLRADLQDMPRQGLDVISEAMAWQNAEENALVRVEKRKEPWAKECCSYYVNSTLIATKCVYENDDVEYTLLRPSSGEDRFRHIWVRANGNWEDVYWDEAGNKAVSITLDADTQKYVLSFYANDGSFSWFVSMENGADHSLYYVDLPEGKVVVAANARGTEYAEVDDYGLRKTHTWYYRDGSGQTDYYENGVIVRKETFSAAETEPTQ